jgi:hypothetical protein
MTEETEAAMHAEMDAARQARTKKLEQGGMTTRERAELRIAFMRQLNAIRVKYSQPETLTDSDPPH